MRAIVTGGAGFIGSHMFDLLVGRGFDVLVLVNSAAARPENLQRHHNAPRCAVHQMDLCRLPADSPLFHAVAYVFHEHTSGSLAPIARRHGGPHDNKT